MYINIEMYSLRIASVRIISLKLSSCATHALKDVLQKFSVLD